MDWSRTEACSPLFVARFNELISQAVLSVLFRIAGIQVYLRWTGLAVAYFEIVSRVKKYQSMTWNVIEYLALFGIVLLHEFGHALASRQVGRQADRIMLWPLGGVAFVQPRPRPGALLWSIAAGPLVNVILCVPRLR
jgi:Zn-dependent protease